MKTRAIPGPRGPFLIPAEPESTSMHAERCCRSVFEGEYSYPRESPEDVRTVLDIGANVGAFAVWAMTWWPTLRHLIPYEPNPDAGMLALENIGRVGQIDLPQLVQAAVTSRMSAQTMTDDENWGARRVVLAMNRPVGNIVTPLHPGDLPPADAIKCDVEGNGAEVFTFYQHWSGIKVALYESHNAEERDIMAAVCERAGLRIVRGNPNNPECDVRVWVRP